MSSNKHTPQLRIDAPAADGPAVAQPIASSALTLAPPGLIVPAPTGLTVTASGVIQGGATPRGYADLAWLPGAGTLPGATYQVQWSADSAFASGVSQANAVGSPVRVDTLAAPLPPIASITYYFRVRAVVSGQASSWSAAVSAVIPLDLAAPGPVTGAAFSWSGRTGDLTLSWTNPQGGTFQTVRVQIYASNGGTLLRTVFVPGSSYVWTLAQQSADRGGLPLPAAASCYVVITARSYAEVYSTAVNLSPTLAAPGAPAGLTHGWSGDTGTAGADLAVSWTASADVPVYRLSVDGVARDVVGGRTVYTFGQNVAEHSGTPDPVLSLSLVAVDALGQTSTASTATATNAAPPATTITAFTGFSTVGLEIAASTAADLKDYRIRIYKNAVLVRTFYSTSPRVDYQIQDGDGTYTADVTVRDMFGQLSAASAVTSGIVLVDPVQFVADLRAEVLYSDSIPTAAATLAAALKDGALSAGGVSYALAAGWSRWIRAEREQEYRLRTVTLSMTPVSGTSAWYIRTSTDGTSWTYFAGPVTSGRIVTLVASEAAAQTAAISAATLGGPAASRVDLPAVRDVRFVEVWVRNTAAATRVDEFYPRKLVQGDDIEAEAIKAINIAVGSLTGDRLTATAIDGFTITGSTIRSGSGSTRIEFNSTSLDVINAGVTRVRLDTNGLTTYNSAGQVVIEATTATDGALRAGQGKIILNRSGLFLLGGTMGDASSIFIRDATNTIPIGHITTSDAGGGELEINIANAANVASTGISYSGLALFRDASHALTTMIAKSAAGTSTRIILSSVTDTATVTGGLNVGSATGAASGHIRAGSRIVSNGGISAGGDLSPGTGEIIASTTLRVISSSSGNLLLLGGDNSGSVDQVFFQMQRTAATGGHILIDGFRSGIGGAMLAFQTVYGGSMKFGAWTGINCDPISGQYVRIRTAADTNASYPFTVVQTDNVNSLFWVRGDGHAYVKTQLTVNATAYTSDASLKEDVQAIPDALDLLRRIPARRFRWKDSPARLNYGVIAQEVAAVLPDLVDHVQPDPRAVHGQEGPDPAPVATVRLTDFIGILIAAVQRLDQRLAALEARP